MLGQKNTGYTIVEVLIFLAVSSLMFVIGMTSINGRQEQVRFSQAVRELDSVLQDYINDVSTGYYPSSGNISCRVNARNYTITADSTQAAGGNEECMLLGKAIQFSPDDGDAQSVNANKLAIYDVVGTRFISDISPPLTYDDANPEAVPFGEFRELSAGLEITAVGTIADPSNSQIGGILVFSSLNRAGQSMTSATSERLNIASIPTASLGFNSSESQFLSTVSGVTDRASAGPGGVTVNFSNTSPIVICVADSERNRKASITLGGTVGGTILDFDTYNREVCGP
jgi:type II secretory pathway pseudopilin PulG